MSSSTETAVTRAIETMRTNLGEPLTVDDMARAAMFSKFHFTRMFQRVTGVSPGRFLSALRLERAKHLLVTTQWNIADISLRVGYNSVGTFSSRFTRSVGMSPTAYRRRAGFAGHISMEPAATVARDCGAHVYGEARRVFGQPDGPMFIGLFANRIPEGRPIRCTVLTRPGLFEFDVPPGDWYLLAQTGLCTGVSAALGAESSSSHHGSGPVWVATHGPLTVEPGTVLRVDPAFAPARDLDPPVLLALMDSRKLALQTLADAPPSPFGHSAGAASRRSVRHPADRSAA